MKIDPAHLREISRHPAGYSISAALSDAADTIDSLKDDLMHWKGRVVAREAELDKIRGHLVGLLEFAGVKEWISEAMNEVVE